MSGSAQGGLPCARARACALAGCVHVHASVRGSHACGRVSMYMCVWGVWRDGGLVVALEGRVWSVRARVRASAPTVRDDHVSASAPPGAKRSGRNASGSLQCLHTRSTGSRV
eukprot:1337789-Pleurochrysis_carterae.AAC.1